MKFHANNGRYEALARSRYMTNTYGKASFAPPEEDVPEGQAHGAYGGLLFDPRWKQRRQEILTRDNQQCVICTSNEKLQVHHRQYHFVKALQKYKAPWEYEDRLMITLCERCHTRGHNRYKVPTIYL